VLTLDLTDSTLTSIISNASGLAYVLRWQIVCVYIRSCQPIDGVSAPILVVVCNHRLIHAVIDDILVLKIISRPQLQRAIRGGELNNLVILHIGAILELTRATINERPEGDCSRLDIVPLPLILIAVQKGAVLTRVHIVHNRQQQLLIELKHLAILLQYLPDGVNELQKYWRAVLVRMLI